MKNTKIIVNTRSKSYPIYFGDGNLKTTGTLIKKNLPNVKKICIISDKNLPLVLLKKLSKSLKKYNPKIYRLSVSEKIKNFKIKWILPFFFLLMITASLQAQETGPLMMKQELGYTLGGGVFGAGLGVLVWFMDPLNPSVTLKSTVKNGFIAGTALGALFGFYMLQNAIIVPSESTLPENLDQLLGKEGLLRPIQSSIISQNGIKSVQNIRLPIFGFRF